MVRKNQLLVLLIGAVCLTGIVTLRAETWYVATDGDDVNHTGKGGWDQAYATIGQAVSSSAAEDQILVSNGTYVLTACITVGNRSILGFSGNPADTIVDGNGSMQCFKLNGLRSFVAGMTITNGVEASGGGVRIEAGGTVSNCWIIGNTSTSTDSPYYVGGGGVIFSTTGGTVLDCLIASNISSNDGAGILVRMTSGPVLVRDCVISNNFAVNQGGGVSFYAISDTAIVDRCDILNNTTRTRGGGVFTMSPKSLVRNCLIAGNSVTEASTLKSWLEGGGGVNFYRFGHVANCTIVSNTSNANIGGFMAYLPLSGDAGSVSNTIICFNTVAGENVNWAAISAYRDDIPFSNCCLMPTNNLPASSSGNIEADPLFVDNAGNYRLRASSPCINAGVNQAWMEEARDADGRPRLDWITGQVDIGCYEYVYQGTILLVK